MASNTSSRPNEKRISLVFRMDDPLERAAYELMSSKTAKKSRSHMVSQAILGFLYLNSEGLLEVNTIQNIIDQSVKSCIDTMPKVAYAQQETTPAGGKPEKATAEEPEKAPPAQQKPKKKQPTIDPEQAAAMDDFVSMFANTF